jgi:hypothetical protein
MNQDAEPVCKDKNQNKNFQNSFWRKQWVDTNARNDPVFDLVLIIQPCNERCFVTWLDLQ